MVIKFLKNIRSIFFTAIFLSCITIGETIANDNVVNINIGFTSEHKPNRDDVKATWVYELRENYITSVQKSCNGILKNGKVYNFVPFVIPSINEHDVLSYTNFFDGIIFVGNFFDINPSLYKEKVFNDTVQIDDKRVNFESKLIKKYQETNKPILAICSGMQLSNVINGGSLVQDIPAQMPQAIKHKGFHVVNIEKDSRLYKILGVEKIDKVKSYHHQAIKEISSSFNIIARSEDGIIEAIEHKTHPYFIGVQWHPEFLITKYDEKIMRSFCQAIVDSKSSN